jgi:hypothetical protein
VCTPQAPGGTGRGSYRGTTRSAPSPTTDPRSRGTGDTGADRTRSGGTHVCERIRPNLRSKRAKFLMAGAPLGFLQACGTSIRQQRHADMPATTFLGSSAKRKLDVAFCGGFRSAGMPRPSTCSCDRRPKSANARNRGGWGADVAAAAMGIWRRGAVPGGLAAAVDAVA